jgi:hypothetical protein
LVGLYLLVFIQKKHTEKIKSIHIDSINRGVLGAGNKGAVSISIK